LKRLKDRPNIGKLCKPDFVYQEQVKWHPSLTDKLTLVENVIN